MTNDDKKHVISFLRRIASKIELNENFDFSFSVLPKKPSTISIDREVTHPDLNDFDIHLSVRDFQREDTQA